MNIHENVSLSAHTTMRLGGTARYFSLAYKLEEIVETYQYAKSQGLPVFVLGGGSNVIAHDEGFGGIILQPRIMGFDIISQDDATVTIKIGTGENWDDVVNRSVDMNLSGIETMAGIPGTAGAAPVQNIGAYGQELADTFVSLEAYDPENNQVVAFNRELCEFSYRNSIFRGSAKGKYVILSITLQLRRSPTSPPYYEAIQNYLDANNITIVTTAVLRDTVKTIRQEKLPDPAERPNTGSFFKNAIVEEWQLTDLKRDYPDIPTYDLGEHRFKIPSGWLIEQAGFKGQLISGMRVHDKNCLVLINESASGYSDLATAREEIVGKVRDTFRIIIEQEPLEIPA